MATYFMIMKKLINVFYCGRRIMYFYIMDIYEKAKTMVMPIVLLIVISISFPIVASNDQYITYSFADMQRHKELCKQQMKTNPSNINDGSYQMERALRTVSGDDADYIPKVYGAGEIFNDGGITYQLMHNGVKVICDCYYDVRWITDVIYGLKGHHEPQEEKCFYEVLKSIPYGATMIELGAYWGYYSLWFSFRVKNAKNYLVEPDPQRLEVGIKNFEINNKEATFTRAFVGKMKDDEPDITGAEWLSIDDYIEREGIQHVNILHSDIQGAETEMLPTTIKHLNHIDYFFVSTHGHQNHIACLEFFKEHAFIILAEHADVESCSGDGLIVAKRQGVNGPDHISIRKY